MEYRVHITYGGDLEAIGDRLLDALEHHAVGMGPVLSGNTRDGTFTITVATEGRDFSDALAQVQPAARDALAAAGIDAEATGAEVELLDGPAAAAA